MRRPATALLVGFLVVLGPGAAGCSPPGATSSPPPAATARPTPSQPDGPGATIDVEQPGLTPSSGQVDTDWGPIWESLPDGFPVPPLAEPAEAESGPASATYTVPRTDASAPRAIASFYGERFSAAGYGGGLDGPLEDGSYVAWASNGYGCDIQVTVRPRGEVESLVTVLYGAGCPFEWPADD